MLHSVRIPLSGIHCSEKRINTKLGNLSSLCFQTILLPFCYLALCALCVLLLLSFKFFRNFFLFLNGSQERSTILTVHSSNAIPVPIERHTWSAHPIVKDYFWDRVPKDLVEAGYPFKYKSADSFTSGVPLNNQSFQTLLHDSENGEGELIPPKSVLRMRIEREEVQFYNIKFESKAQRHQFFDKWAGHILAQPGMRELFNDISRVIG